MYMRQSLEEYSYISFHESPSRVRRVFLCGRMERGRWTVMRLIKDFRNFEDASEKGYVNGILQ